MFCAIQGQPLPIKSIMFCLVVQTGNFLPTESIQVSHNVIKEDNFSSDEYSKVRKKISFQDELESQHPIIKILPYTSSPVRMNVAALHFYDQKVDLMSS